MHPSPIRYTLDPATARAAYELSAASLNRRVGQGPAAGVRRLLGWIVVGAVLGMLFGAEAIGDRGSLAGLIVLLVLAGLLSASAARRRLFGYLGRSYAEASGEISLRLTERGIEDVSGLGVSLLPWSRVAEVSEQPGWIAIVLGPVPQVLAVADSAFADGTQRAQWLAALRAGMAGAAVSGPAGDEAPLPRPADDVVATAAGAPPFAAGGPAPEPRRGSFVDDLHQLGRILLLRPPLAGSLVADAASLVLAVLVFGLLTLALQILAEGYPGELVWYEATELLSPFAGAALVASLALLAARRRVAAGRLLIAFTLLLLPLPLTALWTELPVGKLIAARGLAPEGGLLATLWALYYLPQLWLLLAGAVLVWRLVDGSRGLRALAAGVATLAMAGNLWLHLEPPELWYVAPAEGAGKPRLRIDESVLYGQPRVLERQLAGLLPGRAGVPEIYFLGVGGDGGQDVFLREVRAVEQLFVQRFGTAGHSAVLVNNPATVQDLPVANRESLAVALREIGARMNGEEDLLFLFLTSHGSPNHRFSLSFWPFQFEDITPGMLRRALDDAGIPRRVVVISACYSGGFIPALEDEHTLVITAAAADRNSFGCADHNEFTDFGRAYFHEALRETRSFTEAFEIASTRIASREQAEGLLASLPQMRGGAALAPMLLQFAREPSPAPAPAHLQKVGAALP